MCFTLHMFGVWKCMRGKDGTHNIKNETMSFLQPFTELFKYKYGIKPSYRIFCLHFLSYQLIQNITYI